MASSYHAELIDVDNGIGISLYRYVFKSENISEARAHAERVAMSIGIVPIAVVKRINLQAYNSLASRYFVPTKHKDVKIS